jgi:predicted Zn-dependent protease
MEPPFWYYPVRQSLGEALLKAGRTEEAIEAFKTSLEQVPNNGWALRELLRAQQQAGDAAGATVTAAELAKAWPKERDPLDGQSM